MVPQATETRKMGSFRTSHAMAMARRGRASSGTNSFGGSDLFQVLAAHNPRILQLGARFYF